MRSYDASFIFLMSLFACGIIHQGQEQLNDESQARKEINVCLAALLRDHFLPIRKWKCQDIDQVLFHRRFFPSASGKY